MSPASMQGQDHYSSSESGEVEIGDRLGWLTKLGEGGERIPSAVMGCLLGITPRRIEWTLRGHCFNLCRDSTYKL